MESGLASPTQIAKGGKGIHQQEEDRSSLGLRIPLTNEYARMGA